MSAPDSPAPTISTFLPATCAAAPVLGAVHHGARERLLTRKPRDVGMLVQTGADGDGVERLVALAVGPAERTLQPRAPAPGHRLTVVPKRMCRLTPNASQ